ncbi:MAG TPA: MBL fold metallo-hydrolase [Pseudonocardiaceae bacterium]
MSWRRSSTIAIGDGAGEWFLGNASPELDVELRECTALWPRSGESTAPIHGVFLTDAELDNTLGLLSLRQAGELHIYGTAAMRILLAGCGVLPTLESYTQVHWHDVRPGERFALQYRDGADSPMSCEPFDASSGRLPRYARGRYADNQSPNSGVVIGYRITDRRTDRCLVFLPSVAVLDDALLEHLGGAHLILLDGTFWDDDELSRHGRGTATARSMGHQPVDGADGSLCLLADPARGRVVYTHVNNTNPMLLEDSPERASLTSAGASVAEDGAEFEL